MLKINIILFASIEASNLPVCGLLKNSLYDGTVQLGYTHLIPLLGKPGARCKPFHIVNSYISQLRCQSHLFTSGTELPSDLSVENRFVLINFQVAGSYNLTGNIAELLMKRNEQYINTKGRRSKIVGAFKQKHHCERWTHLMTRLKISNKEMQMAP